MDSSLSLFETKTPRLLFLLLLLLFFLGCGGARVRQTRRVNTLRCLASAAWPRAFWHVLEELEWLFAFAICRRLAQRDQGHAARLAPTRPTIFEIVNFGNSMGYPSKVCIFEYLEVLTKFSRP